MFGLFKKNTTKKVEKKYADLMTKAVEAQRNGNIDLYSKLSFEADEILKEIDSLKEIEDKK
ncbi:DUF6435 family protein [Halobacteriovorax sp.]|uniref:DUF6435 family protein n=1 Tax=Halobacteriovorax sp. TaxID=2020862 RepID=UPI003565F770